jgi:hypothetical protein
MAGRRVDAGWAALLDVDGVQVVVRARKVMLSIGRNCV